MEKVISIVKKYAHRYFVQAMSAMALGLFSSLIIGLILSQLGQIPILSKFTEFSSVVSASSPVVGGAIGAAVSWGLKAKPLVMLSSIVTGAFGYSLGGPVGAYVAAVIGSEIGMIFSGKTKVDIIISPLTTIISGCFGGLLIGPPIQSFMTALGMVINSATELSPVPMGVLVAVIVGLALTAPISSAALCIMLELDGLAAGAAVVGCSAQMIGFAVTSFKVNGWGGAISQGLGTSMLQFSNIMKKPAIWLAPTITSAILGPISTTVFKMVNTSTGAGMGTSGLVGQFGAVSATGTENLGYTILIVILMHFVLPAVISLGFHLLFKNMGIVNDEDLLVKFE